MRILWVLRGGGDAASDAGDAIYDRKIGAALRQTHAFETVGTTRSGRLAQLARAAVHVAAPETFGFDSEEMIARVCQAVAHHRPEAIVFSHEHLDRLAAAVRRQLGDHAPAFVTIRHNVTSDAMASILADMPPAAALYRALAQRQERAALASPLFQGVVSLSVRDRALIVRLYGRDDTALALPGAPPALALHPDAQITRDLLLLGTYDWFPKARDLSRFASDLSHTPLTDVRVYGDAGVPPDVAAHLSMTPSRELDLSAAIRFGVITDRFTAGHKLKTAAYLMQNCAVITFGDVIDDFASLPNAARWIHRVRSTADIAPVMDEMTARPPDEVRDELAALKVQIAEAVAWSASATAIASAIARAIRGS